ncbi:MAG: CPBP family intramembrane glutamic endopeptidase [Chloroflexota bacterium]
MEAIEGETTPRARRMSRESLFIIFYLILITMAEVVTALVHPLAGIAFHAVLLTALVVHCAVVEEAVLHRLLLPLTLAPLTRILSLSMPLTVLSQIYWYPIIYAPLAAGTVVVMRETGMAWKDVGMSPSRPLLQVTVLPVGLLMGVVEYYILRPEPLVAELAVGGLVFTSLVFFVTTGFVEEWVFRGVMQRAMGERFGWWGLVYTSLLFAVLHLGFLSVFDLAFVFAVALFFSWVVNKTGSLLGVALAHGLTNVGLYVVFPLLLD